MLKQRGIFSVLATSLIIITPLINAQETKQTEQEELYLRYMKFRSYVKGGIIEPHWMEDGNRFWFVEGAPENTVIYLVDPVANQKTELFNTERLRKAIANVLGHEPPYNGVPFNDFIFLEGEKVVEFNVEDKDFILKLDDYSISEALKPSEREKKKWGPEQYEVLSPDGLWILTIKDHNLWLRSTSDGAETQVTTDGVKDYRWQFWKAKWSPNSSELAIVREDWRDVPKLPLIQWLKPEEGVVWTRRERPGLPLRQCELYILEIPSVHQVRIVAGEEPDQRLEILGWRHDGSELFFERINREWKRRDLMAANTKTGSCRVVWTRETQTSFASDPSECYEVDGYFAFLPDGMRFIRTSEEDGWNHLYLYDVEGKPIRQLTKGTFPVERLVAVDDVSEQVYFTARVDRQRPYDIHLCRVNYEGQGFTRLTEASANHDSTRWVWRDYRQTIRFSPSKEFFLDTYSTVNRPPVVELRKADGTLLQTLSRANIDKLREELEWNPLEKFVVQAADGKTALYGVLFKPYDFDSNKKYPVIEFVHYDEIVPRTFISNLTSWHAQALANQGFILFMVDGRGTGGRGKKFWETFYGDGFYGISSVDHVATLLQLAQKRPYMDLDRVGVYGISGGGGPALLAMLQAPEIYKVGVIGEPCDLDPFEMEPRWIEPLLGLPQDNPEGYHRASLLKLAENLKGKLLLIHGTSDEACPCYNTIKTVEALIRASKPFDLLIFPEENHDFGRMPENWPYYLDSVRRYFVEHLKPEIGR